MEKELKELYELTIKEGEGELTEEDNVRYLFLWESLNKNNIEIPFGVNI